LKSVERVEDPSTMWWDRILMELLFFTGARASEVLRIAINNVRDDGVFIRSSKSEKPRFVPLPQEVIDHVRKYVENYRISSDPKALLTTKEGRMTYNYLRSRVALIGKRAGVPRMHPHAARHWLATSLLKAGTDIRVIQEVLSHADLSSTQVYTHLARTDIGRMVRPISSELFRKSTEPGGVKIPLGTFRDSDGTAEI
jgi:integrase/recombinase XerD